MRGTVSDLKSNEASGAHWVYPSEAVAGGICVICERWSLESQCRIIVDLTLRISLISVH